MGTGVIEQKDVKDIVLKEIWEHLNITNWVFREWGEEVAQNISARIMEHLEAKNIICMRGA